MEEEKKASAIAKQAAKEALLEALALVQKSESTEEAVKKIEQLIKNK